MFTRCRAIPSIRRTVFGSSRVIIPPNRSTITDLSRCYHNVGIFAHIDAGKTTTSEAILYLCGRTRSIGLVDTGDTIMDFLPQEKERGITISSAAISCQWKNFTINLIDTPGHVDFSMEVERTARVLDGGVLLIDAVAGVQAQTKSVYRCMAKRALPTIGFINKMDRNGVDWRAAVKSIETKLGASPLPLQYPFEDKEGIFEGVVDLLTMQVLTWQRAESKGQPSAMAVRPICSESDRFYDDAKAARKEMLECLADRDERLMELLLEADCEVEDAEISLNEVLAAIKRTCISRQFIPVFFGASLRGKGVQPLLDGVVSFLPDADEEMLANPQQLYSALQGQSARREKLVGAAQKKLCALAFKVVNDPHRGLLVYARIYSGNLRAKQSLYNSTADADEKVNQLLSINADELAVLDEAGAGTVCCILGLKNTRSGDTLLSSTDTDWVRRRYVLEGLSIPRPVYSIALEPEKESQQRELERALRVLSIEDPSVEIETDSESGQTIVRGLGELHLEILRDKLLREYKLDVTVSKTYIAFRETLELSEEKIDIKHEVDQMNKEGKHIYVELGLEVSTLSTAENSCQDCVVEVSEEVKSLLRNDEYSALVDAANNSLRHGRRGYQLVGLKLRFTEAKRVEGATTVGAIRQCVVAIMHKILNREEHRMLEPIMTMEISLPQRAVGDIVNDLTSVRRADIQNIQEMGTDVAIITALVPMQTILGYAKYLRSRTQGEGSFSAEYQHHQLVDSSLVQ